MSDAALGMIGSLSVGFKLDGVDDAIAKITAVGASMKATQGSISGSASKVSSDIDKTSKDIGRSAGDIGKSVSGVGRQMELFSTSTSGAEREIVSNLGKIGQGFSMLGSDALGALGWLRTNIPGVNAAITLMGRAWTSVAATIGRALSAVMTTVGSWVSAVRGAFTAASTAVDQIVGRMVAAVVSRLSSLLSLVTAPLRAIQSAFQVAFSFIGDAAEAVGARLARSFAGVGLITQGMRGIVSDASSAISGAFGAMGSAIGSALGGVGEWIGSTLGKVGELRKAVGEQLTSAFESLSESTANIPVIGGVLSSTFGGLAKVIGSCPELILAVAAAFGVLLASIAPLVVSIGLLIVGATTIVAAFTVSLASLLVVLGLVVGGLAVASGGLVILAAATGALGDASGKGAASAAQLEQATAALTAAQKKYGDASYQAAEAQQKLNELEAQGKGPIAELEATWKGVADTLGKLAAGPAGEIIRWLDGLAGPIQALGSQLIRYLGAELPSILAVLNPLVQTFFAIWEADGPQIVALINNVVSMMPQFEPVLQLLMRLGNSAVLGLLTNLTNLGGWFLKTLPQTGPIVSQIFGFLGTTVQKVGAALGQMVMWFVDHWPQILKWVSALTGAFNQGFGAIGPLIAATVQFIQHMLSIPGVLPGLKLLAEFIGITLKVAFMVLMGVIEAFVVVIVVMALEALAVKGQVGAAWDWLSSKTEQVFSAISGFVENHFGGLKTTVQSALNDVIGVINNFITLIDKLPGVSVAKLGLISFSYTASSNAGGGGGSVKAFAQGGFVHGLGGGDTVPAMLTPGEGVLTRAAVRGLGGAPAIHAINNAAKFADGGVVGEVQKFASGGIVGSYGGQCVVFVEKETGVHFPVDYASQMSAYVNAKSPAVGEIGVSTIPPYGHTFIVNGPNSVIDSNWVAPLTIGVHALSGIPDIVGYINLGKGLPANLSGLATAGPDLLTQIGNIASGISTAGVPSWLSGMPKDIINMSVSSIASAGEQVLSGVGNWIGTDVRSTTQAAQGLASSASQHVFDSGGLLPPGISTVFNGTGQAETVRTAAQEAALGSGVDPATLLQRIALAAEALVTLQGSKGRTPSATGAARRRFAT